MEEQRISNLEKWQYVLPIIQNLLPGDIAIGLTDRQRYLQYLRGREFDLKIQIGASIKPGSSVQTPVQRKKYPLSLRMCPEHVKSLSSWRETQMTGSKKPITYLM